MRLDGDRDAETDSDIGTCKETQDTQTRTHGCTHKYTEQHGSPRVVMSIPLVSGVLRWFVDVSDVVVNVVKLL